MITLSKGNKKLVSTDKVKFLIFNLPAQITCPCSTPACRALCYAKKSERIYPQVLPCREENFKATLEPDFIADMVFAIQTEIKKRSYIGKKILFRIHESGDFYSKSYALDFIIIAKFFPNIQFLAYTKSIKYFEFVELPDNFTVRASIWHDTPQNDLQRVNRMDLPTYTALDVQAFTEESEAIKCHCSVGCGDCQMCWYKSIKNIVTKIH